MITKIKEYNYITVLSNWILGFDKYSNTYSKNLIDKSKFPNEFYLLDNDNLNIGINKNKNLLEKLDIKDNTLIRIVTNDFIEEPKPNLKNGLGFVIKSSNIKVKKVFLLKNENWIETSIEDLTSLSYKINNLKSYQELMPRSLSILPVTGKCQAKCLFCFSETSISKESKLFLNLNNIQFENICTKAKELGANRFVITGGGEPTFLNFNDLCNYISIAKKYFQKTILITNGVLLNNDLKLKHLESVGLDILAISRHSNDTDINMEIMGINNKTEMVLNKISKTKIKPRLVCVLQKKGVHDENSIDGYLKYAVDNNVEQVCFKELYVSSQYESIYNNTKENEYCKVNQVPLKIIIEHLENKMLFKKTKELPWGSPVYEGEYLGKKLEIACYTEPSVGWEKLHGICRSWNVLSDGKTYASLEDVNSILEI